MSTTQDILADCVAQLRRKAPQFHAEVFPEAPDDYRLNHPAGAFLVAYAGSRYGRVQDTGFVAQERDVVLTITVVCRQLNGRNGAIEALDLVRASLLGYRLPDCRKAQAREDKFLGETAGLWKYALTVSAATMAIEDAEVDTGAPLTQVIYEEDAA